MYGARPMFSPAEPNSAPFTRLNTGMWNMPKQPLKEPPTAWQVKVVSDQHQLCAANTVAQSQCSAQNDVGGGVLCLVFLPDVARRHSMVLQVGGHVLSFAHDPGGLHYTPRARDDDLGQWVAHGMAGPVVLQGCAASGAM